MRQTGATVGFVTTSFPRWEDDWCGSFVWRLASSLVQRGHRVEVILPDSLDGKWGEGQGWLRGISVRPVRSGYSNSGCGLFYGAGVLDNLRARPYCAMDIPVAVTAMAKAVRERSDGWDAVLAHWLFPSALICKAASSPTIRNPLQSVLGPTCWATLCGDVMTEFGKDDQAMLGLAE